MSDFVTISDAINKFSNGTKSPAFTETVIKESDLKAGTGKNGDWTRKIFTIQDENNNTIDITAWNDEIKLLKVSYKYSFSNLFWKTYEDEINVNIGKYAQINCIGSAIPTQQEELPTKESSSSSTSPTQESSNNNNPSSPTITTPPTPEEYLKQRQQQVQNQTERKIHETFSEKHLIEINQEITILQILESRITDKLTENDISPNPAKVGMYMKFIYDKIDSLVLVKNEQSVTTTKTKDPENYCSCNKFIPNSLSNGKTCQTCLKLRPLEVSS